MLGLIVREAGTQIKGLGQQEPLVSVAGLIVREMGTQIKELEQQEV